MRQGEGTSERLDERAYAAICRKLNFLGPRDDAP